ncbi:MAG: DUF4430 domain-containing protein [Candidatus Paceibacterota bacterium]
MKKDLLKVSILIVFTLALIGGVSFLINQTKPSPSPVSQIKTATISLSVQGVYEGKQVAITEGETVLAVLEKLNAEDTKLQLSTKSYTGLGTLIDSFGIYKNGIDKKYWQYKVNGVMPQIGADQYILKAGDSVEWLFATSRE